jgi:hypothetical protein
VFENARYVLNSTAHWRPLMNGYSGYTPASYADAAILMSRFPDPRASARMALAGVTHVTVHPDRYGSGAAGVFEELSRRREFTLIAVDTATGIRLYRFTPQP